MDVAYSSESPNRPVRRPNACVQCGAFRLIREQYEAPTAHFAYCRNYVDQGVIQMNGPAAAPSRRQR